MAKIRLTSDDWAGDPTSAAEAGQPEYPRPQVPAALSPSTPPLTLPPTGGSMPPFQGGGMGIPPNLGRLYTRAADVLGMDVDQINTVLTRRFGTGFETMSVTTLGLELKQYIEARGGLVAGQQAKISQWEASHSPVARNIAETTSRPLKPGEAPAGGEFQYGARAYPTEETLAASGYPVSGGQVTMGIEDVAKAPKRWRTAFQQGPTVSISGRGLQQMSFTAPGAEAPEEMYRVEALIGMGPVAPPGGGWYDPDEMLAGGQFTRVGLKRVRLPQDVGGEDITLELGQRAAAGETALKAFPGHRGIPVERQYEDAYVKWWGVVPRKDEETGRESEELMVQLGQRFPRGTPVPIKAGPKAGAGPWMGLSKGTGVQYAAGMRDPITIAQISLGMMTPQEQRQRLGRELTGKWQPEWYQEWVEKVAIPGLGWHGMPRTAYSARDPAVQHMVEQGILTGVEDIPKTGMISAVKRVMGMKIPFGVQPLEPWKFTKGVIGGETADVIRRVHGKELHQHLQTIAAPRLRDIRDIGSAYMRNVAPEAMVGDKPLSVTDIDWGKVSAGVVTRLEKLGITPEEAKIGQMGQLTLEQVAETHGRQQISFPRPGGGEMVMPSIAAAEQKGGRTPVEGQIWGLYANYARLMTEYQRTLRQEKGAPTPGYEAALTKAMEGRGPEGWGGLRGLVSSGEFRRTARGLPVGQAQFGGRYSAMEELPENRFFMGKDMLMEVLQPHAGPGVKLEQLAENLIMGKGEARAMLWRDPLVWPEQQIKMVGKFMSFPELQKLMPDLTREEYEKHGAGVRVSRAVQAAMGGDDDWDPHTGTFVSKWWMEEDRLKYHHFAEVSTRSEVTRLAEMHPAGETQKYIEDIDKFTTVEQASEWLRGAGKTMPLEEVEAGFAGVAKSKKGIGSAHSLFIRELPGRIHGESLAAKSTRAQMGKYYMTVQEMEELTGVPKRLTDLYTRMNAASLGGMIGKPEEGRFFNLQTPNMMMAATFQMVAGWGGEEGITPIARATLLAGPEHPRLADIVRSVEQFEAAPEGSGKRARAIDQMTKLTAGTGEQQFYNWTKVSPLGGALFQRAAGREKRAGTTWETKGGATKSYDPNYEEREAARAGTALAAYRRQKYREVYSTDVETGEVVNLATQPLEEALGAMGDMLRFPELKPPEEVRRVRATLLGFGVDPTKIGRFALPGVEPEVEAAQAPTSAAEVLAPSEEVPGDLRSRIAALAQTTFGIDPGVKGSATRLYQFVQESQQTRRGGSQTPLRKALNQMLGEMPQEERSEATGMWREEVGKYGLTMAEGKGGMYHQYREFLTRFEKFAPAQKFTNPRDQDPADTPAFVTKKEARLLQRMESKQVPPQAVEDAISKKPSSSERFASLTTEFNAMSEGEQAAYRARHSTLDPNADTFGRGSERYFGSSFAPFGEMSMEEALAAIEAENEAAQEQAAGVQTAARQRGAAIAAAGGEWGELPGGGPSGRGGREDALAALGGLMGGGQQPGHVWVSGDVGMGGRTSWRAGFEPFSELSPKMTAAVDALDKWTTEINELQEVGGELSEQQRKTVRVVQDWIDQAVQAEAIAKEAPGLAGQLPGIQRLLGTRAGGARVRAGGAIGVGRIEEMAAQAEMQEAETRGGFGEPPPGRIGGFISRMVGPEGEGPMGAGGPFRGVENVFSQLTDYWKMFRMQRVWGMTGGAVMGQIPVAAQQEQAATRAAMATMPMGQGAAGGMTLDLMAYGAQRQAWQAQVGRVAHGAWGWTQQGALGRGTAAAAGIGGWAIGAGALTGMGAQALVPGLAATAVGAPVAAAVALIGGTIYATAQTDPNVAANEIEAYEEMQRMQQGGLAGLGGAIEVGARAWSMPLLHPGEFKEYMAEHPGLSGREAANQWAAEQAVSGRRIVEEPLAELRPSGRAAAIQREVGLATEKGAPLYGFEQPAVSAALEQWYAYTPGAEQQRPGEILEDPRFAAMMMRGTGPATYAQIGGQWGMEPGRWGEVQQMMGRVPQAQAQDLLFAAGQYGALQRFMPREEILQKAFGQMGAGETFGEPGMVELPGGRGFAPGVSEPEWGTMTGEQALQVERLGAMDPQAWSRLGTFGGEIGDTGLQVQPETWGLVTQQPGTGMTIGTNWGGGILTERARAGEFPGMGQLALEALRSENITIDGTDATINLTVGDTQYAAPVTQRGLQDLTTRMQRGEREYQWGQQEEALAVQYAYTTGGALGGVPAAAGAQQFMGRGLWQMQDEMTGMQRGYQETQFGFQWEQMGLQDQQFQQRWGLSQQRLQAQAQWGRQDLGQQYERRMTQFGWAEENLQFQGAKGAIQYGWQMEDIEENMRYATGRQRRQLMTQRERATVSYGMQMGQLETEEGRLDTRREWAEEDFQRDEERFEIRMGWSEEELNLQLEHHEQNMDLAQRRLTESERYFHELIPLQDELRDTSRALWEYNITKSVESLGHAKDLAAALDLVMSTLTGISQSQEQTLANFSAAFSEDGMVTKAFESFADGVAQPFGPGGYVDMQLSNFLGKLYSGLAGAGNIISGWSTVLHGNTYDLEGDNGGVQVV